VNVVFALAYPSSPAIATVSHRPELAALLDSRTANSKVLDELGVGSGLGLEATGALGRGVTKAVDVAALGVAAATAGGEVAGRA
jgi:hypothetical protein